jgi:predicted nicotinamide N-methyase
MAPTEREQVITKEDENGASSMYTHQWIQFGLPFLNKTLDIRTVKSKVALLDSHVGEELWDAAKLFCAHLCRTALDDCHCSRKKDDDDDDEQGKILLCDGKRLVGKRVLELGAGVGSLGMCIAALGADEVVCTDYDKDVLDNLFYNVCHNMDVIHNHNTGKGEEESNFGHKAKVRVTRLDWRSFAARDVQNVSWLMLEESKASSNWMNSISSSSSNNNGCMDFKPDILIGSALIYSGQGALYCADTICFYLMEKKAKECWILQMPDRPGFDRFLWRLEHHHGLAYECSGVCEETFQIAERYMGRIHSNREDFQMYVIYMK